MNSRSQIMTSAHKVNTWNIMSPFLTGMAGVGLGILGGFYLGLL
ncbi:hypothetical protein CY0110_14135 [Crocosphaera chwakensis CCY0110]|uniref:Uncharacterized protein n=1 Tax=Crocosphaera chwakensis CCY0110 TaxID=391612 RepID=A3IZJ6_9CHRO|nr:hypothetical protein CY0110_14135 [Crocosphaera chwakensis CCY0110]